MTPRINPFSLEDGWLSASSSITIQPSPNFNMRPVDVPINLLVIHNISLPPKVFGGCYIEDFFLNTLDIQAHPYFFEIQNLHVSSHFLIKRNGDIVQFVSCNDRAWHAGKSCFKGRDECNDYSIGIELEGADDIHYTDQQYSVLSSLTLSLMESYPAITRERIVGHCDIAPGRKTDPGEVFDWQKYKNML